MAGWLACLLAAGSDCLRGQGLVLNEVQSSNGTTLTDDSAGTPDWLELFNAGPTTVDLAGWGLSDDPSAAFKWVFTNASIGPGEFMLVYASGNNRQTGFAPPLAPAAVPGLKVWLRADAISASDPAQVRQSGASLFVRRWNDQSGQGLHAQQGSDGSQPLFVASAPEFNGRPVLRFDGADDVLYLPAVPAANSFCVVAVARARGAHEIDAPSSGGVGGVSGQRYLFGAQHGGDYGAGAGLSLGTNGASVYEHGSGYMPALAVGGGVGAGAAVVAMNYSNRQPTLWVQGNLAARGLASARNNVTAPVEIGAGAYGAFWGDVAEILYFDRTLTETEALGLQQHFAEKYAISFPRYYHTSFKMDADGEPLLLTRPDGALEDFILAPAMPRDVSFGRQPDGAGGLYFFAVPTPGAPNTTPGVTDFLGPPAFSAPAGFFTSAVTVSILDTNAGAQIRYTLDGSEPSTNSPLYTSPFTFTNRAGTPNDLSLIPTAGGWQPPLGEVYKVHVLRARAFRTNALPSPTTTATYAVDPLGRARYPLPVVSLTTDRRNFFDPDIGLYVCGNTPGCNYAQSGDAWERPVHVEFFETNGARAFAQESGVRMHGNTSFGFPIKALRLHPLNQKGTGPFRYPIFPDLPIREFDRLLLRPSGHDHYLTMMRDGLMQNLVRELGLDLQGYRPAIVFLNGEYWGVHNLQEAYEKNYFARHHPGVDPEALDYLEGYAPGAFAYEGDSAHFDRLIAFLQTADLRQATNLATVAAWMDLDNYRDYKAAETFYYRWDIGNQRVWRPRTSEGRLRWILFDCDVGYGGFWAQPAQAPWTFNMLAYNLEPNGPWTHYQPGNDHNAPQVTLQLRALMTNPDFKRDFINRCADLMNTTLSTGRMTNLIQRMAAEIAPVMAEHCARWRAPADWTTWSNNVEFLKQFALQRPEYMRRHLTNQFGLRGWGNVTLRVSDTNAGAIRVNTIVVVAPTNAPWTGVYFRDNAVTFAAEPQPGYRFKNWQGFFGPLATNQTNTVLLSGNLSLTANFESTPDTNPPVPLPYDLSAGPYVFSRWDAAQPAGTYPAHMVFLQTETNAAADPGLGVEFTNHWTLPYNRSSRSRVLGLGEDGFSFLNTSDPQADGGGYLGAAVLGLKTTGLTNIQVVWRGGTVTPNSRLYAIRLQHRVGASGPFSDLLDGAAQPVEYRRSAVAGHSSLLGPWALPAPAHNQPYVQLRWKYYWLSGASGPRDHLRVDDIMVVAGGVARPSFGPVERAANSRVSLTFTGTPRLIYSVETSSDLVNWVPLSSVTAGPDGLLAFETDLDPGTTARFYRLRWP
jgi:hypothetical protein